LNQSPLDRKAPDFRQRDINGRVIQLSQLLKKGPVLLNFWATWCGPCLKELPYLDAIGRKYRARGLNVLAISEDGEEATPRVRSFIKGRRFDLVVIVDRNRELYRLYRVAVLPTSLLIDSRGRIVWQHVGYRPGDERILERQIVNLLEQSSEQAP